jgi:hypothetical protein
MLTAARRDREAPCEGYHLAKDLDVSVEDLEGPSVIDVDEKLVRRGPNDAQASGAGALDGGSTDGGAHDVVMALGSRSVTAVHKGHTM